MLTLFHCFYLLTDNLFLLFSPIWRMLINAFKVIF